MKYRACHHSTAGYGTRWCLVFDSCPLPSSMNSHISRGALESLGTPSVRVVMLMIIATQHSNSDIAIRAKKLAELLNSLPPLLSPQGTAARRIQRWVESAGKYRQGVECYVPHPPQCTSDKKSTAALSIPRSTQESAAALTRLENACLCFPEKTPLSWCSRKVITCQPIAVLYLSIKGATAAKVTFIFAF